MLACLRLRAHQCDLPCSCPCVPVAAPGALPDMSPMERAFIAKSEVFDVPMELELRQVALSLSLALSLTRSIARSLARRARALSRALSLSLSLSVAALCLSRSLCAISREERHSALSLCAFSLAYRRLCPAMLRRVCNTCGSAHGLACLCPSQTLRWHSIVSCCMCACHVHSGQSFRCKHPQLPDDLFMVDRVKHTLPGTHRPRNFGRHTCRASAKVGRCQEYVVPGTRDAARVGRRARSAK